MDQTGEGVHVGDDGEVAASFLDWYGKWRRLVKVSLEKFVFTLKLDDDGSGGGG